MPTDRESSLISSKLVKKDEKINFPKARIGKIQREIIELRHKFSKLEIKEIRRNFYEIKTKENLFVLGIEEIEKKP